MRLHSEDHILGILTRHFANSHASLDLARGDDCALVRATGPLCVSSDLFVEDVHFRRSYCSPQEIGHKALAVNISDIAAMGACPTAFTLCLALPPDTDADWLDKLFEGMAALATAHNIALAGGDIAAAPYCTLAITIWGTSENIFLLRGTALAGDTIFVVGHLGLARVGLALLETHGRDGFSHGAVACAAHCMPYPQVAAGLALARLSAISPRPICLMDLSDGLARDLPRLLGWTNAPHRYGAHIHLPHDCLHPELRRYAHAHDLDPVALAFAGGEEYALLGACPPELMPALCDVLPQVHCIGTVTGDGAILCNGVTPQMMGTMGFDHFAQ